MNIIQIPCEMELNKSSVRMSVGIVKFFNDADGMMNVLARNFAAIHRFSTESINMHNDFVCELCVAVRFDSTAISTDV